MSKFKVTIDTSYGFYKGYDEYIVEAEKASKAKYQVAKTMGFGGERFYLFFLFYSETEKVPDDTPVSYKSVELSPNPNEADMPF